jgi:hypothetical protein
MRANDDDDDDENSRRRPGRRRTEEAAGIDAAGCEGGSGRGSHHPAPSPGSGLRLGRPRSDQSHLRHFFRRYINADVESLGREKSSIVLAPTPTPTTTRRVLFQKERFDFLCGSLTTSRRRNKMAGK